MANVLPTEKKLAVLNALVEGCSVRSAERMTGVHRDTICKLLVRVGEGCASLLDEKMIDLDCQRLEMDELWSYIGKKQRNVRAEDDASRVGDCWTFVAIDADTKLILSFRVGKRSTSCSRRLRSVRRERAHGASAQGAGRGEGFDALRSAHARRTRCDRACSDCRWPQGV